MSKWQLLIQSYKIYNYLSLNINVYQKLLVFFIWTNPWISSLILFKVITEPFFEIVEWPKDSIEGGFRSGLLRIKIVKIIVNFQSFTFYEHVSDFVWVPIWVSQKPWDGLPIYALQRLSAKEFLPIFRPLPPNAPRHISAISKDLQYLHSEK